MRDSAHTVAAKRELEHCVECGFTLVYASDQLVCPNRLCGEYGRSVEADDEPEAS